MNNKGFTMIELLASMVLLSILMLVAVPTVLKTMDSSRKTTIINDSKKLVANVEYKLENNNNYIKRPKQINSCIVMTLGFLDFGTDFKEGPHGGLYMADESYVVIKLVGTAPQKYDYYVTLVENYDNNAYYGIYLVSYDTLISRGAKGYVDAFKRDRLLSEQADHEKPLHNNADLTPSGQLGCSNVLINTDDRTTDKFFDSDDALREQGVSNEDINTP